MLMTARQYRLSSYSLDHCDIMQTDLTVSLPIVILKPPTLYKTA